jgi:hypothetical protein
MLEMVGAGDELQARARVAAQAIPARALKGVGKLGGKHDGKVAGQQLSQKMPEEFRVTV